MKEKNTLIENEAHDREDEARNPFDGRSTIGCLLVGVLLLVAGLLVFIKIVTIIILMGIFAIMFMGFASFAENVATAFVFVLLAILSVFVGCLIYFETDNLT